MPGLQRFAVRGRLVGQEAGGRRPAAFSSHTRRTDGAVRACARFAARWPACGDLWLTGEHVCASHTLPVKASSMASIQGLFAFLIHRRFGRGCTLNANVLRDVCSGAYAPWAVGCGLYEGPVVKRRLSCDLQHGQVSSGGAVRRLVLPGRNALAPVAPGGAHPTCIRAVAGGLAGPSLNPACVRAPRSGGGTHLFQRRLSAQPQLGHAPPGPAPAASGRSGNSEFQGLGLRRRARRWAPDRCGHTARARSAACGPVRRS